MITESDPAVSAARGSRVSDGERFAADMAAARRIARQRLISAACEAMGVSVEFVAVDEDRTGRILAVRRTA